MRTLPAALAAVLALAACDGGPLVRGAYTGEAEVELGTAVALDGLAVSFDRVVEDSRCPEDAVCIWPGMAVVALTVEGRPLTLPVVDPDRVAESDVRFGNLVLAAIDLVPYPQHENPSGATPVVTLVTRTVEG